VEEIEEQNRTRGERRDMRERVSDKKFHQEVERKLGWAYLNRYFSMLFGSD
jgi:hypothetical protein